MSVVQLSTANETKVATQQTLHLTRRLSEQAVKHRPKRFIVVVHFY
jgi:hypothetical protein